MFCHSLFQDWQSNPHDLRMRLVLVSFRLAQCMDRQPWWVRVLMSPYFLVYRIVIYWIFHMELNSKLKVGEGLRIFHGYCLVIHPSTCIGRHVTLRHCVTLGNRDSTTRAPVLEDNVEVGANAVIIGPITIGRNAIVGAGAVVTKDVPAGAVVVGNPAKVIKNRPTE